MRETNDPDFEDNNQLQRKFSIAFANNDAGNNWRLKMAVFDQDVVQGNSVWSDDGNSVLGSVTLTVPTSANSRSQNNWGVCGSTSDEHKDSLIRGHLTYHLSVYEKDTTFSCPSGTYLQVRQFESCSSDNSNFECKTCEPGYICEKSYRMPCPEGYFCELAGHTALAGANPPKKCGEGRSKPRKFYCGLGSTAPTLVSDNYRTIPEAGDGLTQVGQVACDSNQFCIDGETAALELCPDGTAGSTGVVDASVGVSASCPQQCRGGYFCPAGSISATRFECGGTAVICPPGSGRPIPVGRGNFSWGGPNERTHTNQTVCTPGTFCQEGIVKSCPEGTYGDRSGLYNESCSGPCIKNALCPAGSTIANHTVVSWDMPNSVMSGTASESSTEAASFVLFDPATTEETVCTIDVDTGSPKCECQQECLR